MTPMPGVIPNSIGRSLLFNRNPLGRGIIGLRFNVKSLSAIKASLTRVGDNRQVERLKSRRLRENHEDFQ